MPSPRFLVLVLALVALAVGPTAFAITPGAQLDQSQTVIDDGGPLEPGLVFGQTFTAGVSGGLTDIVVTLSNSGATENLRAVVTRVDGTGAPDLSSVLATVDLAPGQVQATPTGTELHLAAAPPVVAGETYAIVLSSASAGYGLYGATAIQYYLGGDLYISDGVTWFALAADLAFSTYVLAPSRWRADPVRIAYCLDGRFLDLLAGQPLTDATYASATPAIFVAGKGLTCDPPPPGYVLSGKTTDAEHHVGAGHYDVYAPAG